MKSISHHLPTLALLLVTMIWGSGFIATDYAIASELPTAWIMMIRFLVGAGMLLLLFFRRVVKSSKKTILHGAGAGLILFGAFYTQTVGQGQTTVSNAAFITATNVVMIPFLLWIVTRKRPAIRVFALCLLTMLGMVLLTMQENMQLSFGTGDLLVLACALLFAAHITYLGVCTPNDDPIQIAFWQLLFAGICGVLAVVLTGAKATSVQLSAGIWPAMYLGVFSTGVCYFLQTWAQTKVSAAKAGIVLSLEGFFGTLFSLLLGLETFRWNILLGGLCITASVILSELGGAKKES